MWIFGLRDDDPDRVRCPGWFRTLVVGGFGRSGFADELLADETGPGPHRWIVDWIVAYRCGILLAPPPQPANMPSQC